MQSTLMIHAVIWVIMAVIVGFLALYRKFVSRAEDDVLHLSESASPMVSRQEVFAHRLDAIDRWGKILTIVLISYGVLIACGFLILAWLKSIEPVT